MKKLKNRIMNFILDSFRDEFAVSIQLVDSGKVVGSREYWSYPPIGAIIYDFDGGPRYKIVELKIIGRVGATAVAEVREVVEQHI